MAQCMYSKPAILWRKCLLIPGPPPAASRRSVDLCPVDAGTDSEPVGGNSAGNGLPPMPGMDGTDGPNLAAQMQDAMHSMPVVQPQQLAGQAQGSQQFPVPLPYMLHPGSLMQISPGQTGEGQEGSALPVSTATEVGSVAAANANLLKLFAAACQQKGLVTRTQRTEMVDFVQQMYLDRLAE